MAAAVALLLAKAMLVRWLWAVYLRAVPMLRAVWWLVSCLLCQPGCHFFTGGWGSGSGMVCTIRDRRVPGCALTELLLGLCARFVYLGPAVRIAMTVQCGQVAGPLRNMQLLSLFTSCSSNALVSVRLCTRVLDG